MNNIQTQIQLAIETTGRKDLSATLATLNSIKSALDALQKARVGLGTANKTLETYSQRIDSINSGFSKLEDMAMQATSAVGRFTAEQQKLNGVMKQNAEALREQVSSMRELVKLGGGSLSGYTDRYSKTSRAGMGGRPKKDLVNDIDAAEAAFASINAKRVRDLEAGKTALAQLNKEREKEQKRALAEEKRIQKEEERDLEAHLKALEKLRKDAAARAAAEQKAATKTKKLMGGYDDWITSEIKKTMPRKAGKSFMASAEDGFKNRINAAGGGGIAGLVTGAAAIGLGKALFDSIKEWDNLQKRLLAVSGSAEKANDRLNFLKTTANELGADVKSLADYYTKFSAAADGSGLSESTQRNVVKGLAAANSVLNGGDTVKMQRSMVALEQMLSKGKVQAEELKNQLGDSLPGTMQVAARAAGMSVQQLMDAMKKGMVNAKEFVTLLGNQMLIEFGQKALKTADSVQGQMNRLKNAYTDVIAELDKQGVSKALADGLFNIRTALTEAFDKKGVNGFADALKELIKYLSDAVVMVINFVKNNKEMLAGAATIAKYVIEAKALAIALGTVNSGFNLLKDGLGAFSLMGNVFSVVEAGLVKVGAAANTARLAVIGLQAGLAVIAGGAFAFAQYGKMADSKTAMEKLQKGGWASLNKAETAAALEALKNDRNDSVNNVFRYGADAINGGLNKLGAHRNADTNKALDDEIALGEGRLAALSATEKVKAAKVEKEKYEAEVKKLKEQDEIARKNLLGSPTNKKGDGTRKPYAQADEIRAAQRAAATTEANAELELVRATRAQKLAELNRELEAGKISYANYYASIKAARMTEINEEKSAVFKRIDDEIAAEKQRQGQARDGAAKQASQIKIEALERSKVTLELTYQQKAAAATAEEDEKRSKAVKELALQYAELSAEVDAISGFTNLDSLNAKLTEQYKKLKDTFLANGNTAGAQMIDKKIANELAKARLGNTDESINRNNLDLQNKTAELELSVLQNKKAQFEMDNEALALRKEAAKAALDLLEAELAQTDNKRVQLELQGRILEQKKILAEKTADQKAAESSVSGALERMFGDAQKLSVSLKDLIKNFVTDIANDMQKQLSKKMAEMATNAIFSGGMGGGGGGGSIVGTLLSGFGDMVMGSFGGGSSFFTSAGSIGGGVQTQSAIQQSLPNLLAQGASSQMSSVVNMTVVTPDSNSFRASQTQIRNDLFTAGQRAASRS